MRNKHATQLIFELSRAGRRAVSLPVADVPEQPVEQVIPERFLAGTAPGLPEVSEPEIVRHYANLSTLNMSVDTHFYPLGSCTMKYNPKRNERLASIAGVVDVHPYQSENSIQGLLRIFFEAA